MSRVIVMMLLAMIVFGPVATADPIVEPEAIPPPCDIAREAADGHGILIEHPWYRDCQELLHGQ